MTKSYLAAACSAAFLCSQTSVAFTTLSHTVATRNAFQSSSSSSKQQTIVCMNNNDDGDSNHSQRRNFLGSVSSSILGITTALSSPLFTTNGQPLNVPAAWAIPMATTAEFEGLLKGGAKSVEVVEFNGPKNDIVTVKLIDGTIFGISDVIESSVDPRSPLKIAATCREYKVPTKFVGLEAVLATSSTSKKKQVYMNERVLEAAKKEKEKKERLAQDEADRLRQIREMEEMEMAKTITKPPQESE